MITLELLLLLFITKFI